MQALEPRRLLAAALVTDLNTLPASSNPGSPLASTGAANVVDVNGITYFTATHQDIGTELWRSDGTEAGTFLVKDLSPGTNSSAFNNFTNVNGTLFFAAQTSGAGSYQLYRSDGSTNGTVALGAIHRYITGPDFQFTAVGGTLYFVASKFNGQPSGAAGTGDELWKTDGTTAGTQMVFDSPNYDGLNPRSLTNVNGTLYFGGFGDQNGADSELWKSDGTAAGTVRVKDIYAGSSGSWPTGFTGVGSTIYFTAIDAAGQALWKTDGTEAGTVKVKPSAPSDTPRFFTSDGTSLFFVAEGALWRSDGTETGTTATRTFESAPANLRAIGSTVYFSGQSVAGPYGLWKVSGTSSPVQVQAFSGPLKSLTNVAGALHFVTGNSLYRINAAAAGVTLMKTFPAPPLNLVASGTQLMFAGDDAAGAELWRSNGTAAGTVRVKDIHNATLGSSPTKFVGGAPDGSAVFVATHPDYGLELFVSDGTAAGTRLVKDIYPGPKGANIEYLVRGHDAWYFKAASDVGGDELWRSDGTEAGTQQVFDLRAGIAGGYPYNITPLGNLFVFDAVVPAGGARATYASTGVVGEPFVQIGPGNGSALADFGRAGGLVYFSAGGNDLWVTDGTVAGTRAVANDVLAATTTFDPRFTAIGDTMYFASANGDLWRSNGTVAGTVMLKDLPSTAGTFEMEALGDELFLQSGNDLWRSDGTPGGTTLVQAYPDRPTNLTAVAGPNGNYLYYVVGINVRPRLYRFDVGSGSADVVKDLGTGGGNIGGQLVAFGGRLYFTVNDIVHGNEWWTTGGGGTSAVSTGFVQEIRPGATGAAINGATVIGDALYFSADDGAHGSEPWKLTPFATLDTATGTLTINAGFGFGLGAGAGPATEIAAGHDGAGRFEVVRLGDPSESYAFDTADVDRIVFNGTAGDDFFSLGRANVPLTFNGGGGGDDQFTLAGATVTLVNDAAAASDSLRLFAAVGTITLAAPQRIRQLVIDSGVVHVAPGGDKPLVVDRLEQTGDASGRLDLHDNDLIVRGQPYEEIWALIWQARGPDGDWPGNAAGMTSTAAAASGGLTTLAPAPARAVIDFAGAATAIWNGQTVRPDDVLVKYTYAGDANMDGQVTGDDYGYIDFAILTPDSSGYFNGDFNYDGVINGDDYGVIDFTILAQGAVL